MRCLDMPQKTVHEKIEVEPEYAETQHLVREISNARTYLNELLSIIDGIEDITLQIINIFSLIDMLAQEQANYPPDYKSAFCEFVLKHQKQCDYLEEIEPVTLYYRVEDMIDEVESSPGMPSQKEVSIASLGYLHAKTVKSVLAQGKSKEILDYIVRKNGPEFAAKKSKDHQLISLLYRMRSKAVHEMSGLGQSLRLHKELKPSEPYYREVGRSYVENEHWVHDDVIELVVPNIFVRNILVDCINGYLADCLENKRLPFSNNCLTRKHRLSWYDK